MEPIAVDLDDLVGEPFSIPGGNEPVDSAAVWQDPETRFFASRIRFPEGWERPETGHYVSGEEFVVLDGRLELSGITVDTGHYAWFPPRFLRAATVADGCVAFAWFNGPARWVTGPPDDAPPSDPMVVAAAESGDGPTPFGSPGRLLREEGGLSTWLLGGRLFLDARTAGFLQAISIPDRRFVHLGPGQSVRVPMAPPIIARIRRTSP